MTRLGTPEPEVPPDTWDELPDPDAAAPGDEGSGRYRGRRRALTWMRRRGAQLSIAAVVATVGAVLLGTSVLARSLSEPEAAPAAQPTPSAPPSPSPSSPPLPLPSAPPPTTLAQFGVAPSPDPTPPPPPPEPTEPAAPEPTGEDPPPEDPPEEPPVELSFEAEDAELAGGADADSRQGASGGEAVELRRPWQFVQFGDVAVDEAGEYELTLHYSAPRDAVAVVSVNDRGPRSVECPEPPGNSIGAVAVTVELASGTNTIAITIADDDRPLNLDRITVSG